MATISGGIGCSVGWRLSTLLGVALLTGAFESPAQAQSDQWLMLPSAVTTGDEAPPIGRRASQHLSRALSDRNGPRLMSAERARTRFEQRGSTAPLMVSHSDLDALARDAQMALYHVASGLTGRARDDVERALSRADKVLESLNRESLAAQQLLDACLYLVRAHLTEKQRAEAREQALQCRRLVPDVEPDGTMHPPDVIGILAEAEAELRQREPGSLRVESIPSGCAVFVNGRHLGNAPLELPQLSPGEYRLQAECEEGRVGRVHRVTIGSSRVVKRIDTRFDAAVQTQSDIALRYESVESQRTRAYADAVEIGRVVGASDVILALPMFDAKDKPTDSVQVDRIRVKDGALVAVVRLRVDASGAIDAALLDAAARDLTKEHSIDYTTAAPEAIEKPFAVAQGLPAAASQPVVTQSNAEAPLPASSSAASAEHTALSDEGEQDGWSPPALGLVLGITGGALTLTSWGLYGYQLSLEKTYSDKKLAREDHLPALKAIQDFELLPLVVGGAGALVLSASLPWLLPPAEGVPTWSIVLGGLGGALAVGGVGLLVVGNTCDDFDIEGRCTDILATTRAGGLLLLGSLPFLSLPLVYLFRGLSEAQDSARVTLEPSADGYGAQLMLRGTM